MPRNARILNEKQVYHVMLRGNNKQEIFIDNEDKKNLIEILKEKKRDEGFILYAYCIMNNHLHLVIRESGDSLSRIIKRVATTYAIYFNKKYKKVGHVFQDRFKSENVEDDRYLLCVIRYVHKNPSKAMISTIGGYPWSSYKDYLNNKTELVEIYEILEIFSINKINSIKEFMSFHQENDQDVFLDVSEDKEIDETNVKQFVTEYLVKNEIELSQLKKTQNKKAREVLIKLLMEKSEFSLRAIAQELGLNREMVRAATVSKKLLPS